MNKRFHTRYISNLGQLFKIVLNLNIFDRDTKIKQNTDNHNITIIKGCFYNYRSLDGNHSNTKRLKHILYGASRVNFIIEKLMVDILLLNFQFTPYNL
jgi:hypothetical protein